jgi:hypothetical protein
MTAALSKKINDRQSHSKGYPMHYHLEIVMPPTDDVTAAIEQILAPFDENGANDEDHSTRYAFWDWWQIGGRYGSDKMLAAFDKDRVAAFYKLLNESKITISGVRAGKPTLQPVDQAETVNMMWGDAFPESPVRECPLFDNYTGDNGDVMKLADVPTGVTCSHVIVAAHYKDEGLEAVFMVQDSIWNGVTHCKTAWDGTLAGALAMAAEGRSHYKPEYAAKRTPQPDWLVVTVDYHS